MQNIKNAMQNIKNAMQAVKEAERACDIAYAAWFENPESAELEAAFDAAYKAQHEAEQAFYAAIEGFSNGAIEAKTTRMIWMKRRDQIKSLINRVS